MNNLPTLTNILTERVIRLDQPSYLKDPMRFEASLPVQIATVVPAEPEYFKEWLDQEVGKLVKCEDFVEYLDNFLEE